MKIFPSQNVSDMIIKYKDEEGDIITVSSDTELKEACEIYRDLKKVLFLIAVPREPSETHTDFAAGDADRHSSKAFATGPDPSGMCGRPRVHFGWRSGMGNMMGYFRGHCRGRGLGQFFRGRGRGRGWRCGRGRRGGRGNHRWNGAGNVVPKKLQCRFVRDISVPDASVLSPGQKFTKAWRVSSGDSSWPEGCHLVYVQGELLGATAHRFPVPATPQNTEISLSIEFQAPAKPGRYTSYWRMVEPSGRRFGHRIWVDAIVKTATAADTGEGEEVKPAATPNVSAQTVSSPDKVSVTLPDGSSLHVDCAPGETVDCLKEKLQQVTGVDKSAMLLSTTSPDTQSMLDSGDRSYSPRAPQHIPPGILLNMHGSMAEIEHSIVSNVGAGFPTVAAPYFLVSSGKVMYEVVLQTDGVMQIGWCTSDFQCKPYNAGGYGVGDDPHSWAYDGNRQVVWHNGNTSPYGLPAKWKAGSVISVALDADTGAMQFFLDGVSLGGPAFAGANGIGEGFFPAVSLMAHQKLEFVFSKPFCFPIDGYSAIVRNEHEHERVSVAVAKAELQKAKEIKKQKQHALHKAKNLKRMEKIQKAKDAQSQKQHTLPSAKQDEQVSVAAAKAELRKAKNIKKQKQFALKKAKKVEHLEKKQAKKQAKALRRSERKAAKALRKGKISNAHASTNEWSATSVVDSSLDTPHVAAGTVIDAVAAPPALPSPHIPTTVAMPVPTAFAVPVGATSEGKLLYEDEVRQLQKMGFSQPFIDLQRVLAGVDGKLDEAIGQLLA